MNGDPPADEGDQDLALAQKLTAQRLTRTAASAAAITVAGAPVTLDLSGALYLAEARTLVVSDLHLEKGSALAERRGTLLPPYDTRETLARLHEVIVRLDPARVVALGDSFHDPRGPDRLDEGDRAMIAALIEGRDWVWIAGNHDGDAPASLGGRAAETMAIGPLTLRHDPVAPGADGEVAGHLHPVGKVAMRGRSVRRRCFVTDGRRLVMPAFGAYAGGLNVRDLAYEPLFPRGFTAHLIGDGRLFAIGRAQLARD